MFLTPVTFSRGRVSQRQLQRKNKKILEIRPPNNFHFPVTALFKRQLAEAQLRERKRRLLLSAAGPGTASELADGSLGTWFGNRYLAQPCMLQYGNHSSESKVTHPGPWKPEGQRSGRQFLTPDQTLLPPHGATPSSRKGPPPPSQSKIQTTPGLRLR